MLPIEESRESEAVINMIVKMAALINKSIDDEDDFIPEDKLELDLDPALERSMLDSLDTVLEENNYDVEVAMGRFEAQFKRLFVLIYKAMRTVQEMDKANPLLTDSELAEYDAVMATITQVFLNSENLQKSNIDIADVNEAISDYNNSIQEFGRVIRECLQERINEIRPSVDALRARPRPRM